MQTINGVVFVTDQDLRFFARVVVEGTSRVFHLFPDGDSILHLCEWVNGRYECPPELVASRLAGSSVDTGHRLAGSKHSACVLNVKVKEDGTRILEAMWASRPPPDPGQAAKDVTGSFRGTFRAFPEIRLPPAPWAELKRRVEALEGGMQNETDPLDLAGRVGRLENNVGKAGAILKGE